MEKRKPKNESNDNPFSFRNFLTAPGTTVSNNDATTSNSVSTSNTTSSVNYSPFSNRQREGGDRLTNPYSFARFLQNPITNNNGLILQGELPDFVQDHFSSSYTDSTHRNGLPDFTFHTHNDVASHENGPSLAAVYTASSPDDLFAARLSDDSHRPAISSTANLPDFLSDTGINIIAKDSDTSLSSDQLHAATSLSNINGAHSDSIDYDGYELSVRITQLEHESSQKTIRIYQLEEQLTEQKRKEAEDTEMMEAMMRQVDENLEKAVERWQKSEIEVERLNAKVRSLESRLGQLRSEQSHAPMHLVRHIGAQLSSDLTTADNLMRQFLEHSDKMKTWAGHLQCLDRVEEATQYDQHQSEHSQP